jgi:hypothetical protein
VLRRVRRRWIAVSVPFALLGAAVTAGLHDAGPTEAAGASGLLLGLGFLGSALCGLSAHIRRSTRLTVTSDGTLHLSVFPRRRSRSFVLRQCRQVGLRKAVGHGTGRSSRYDLVVLDGDRKHEYILPGRIGSGGNWSTLSDEQAAAFHAAVGRFTKAAPG